ncbi:MAG: long-chain fatty acid--CoA ligase [Hydrogenophaga sp.]|uniref:acyl-CoA synthetase n=1 Tax=Hydrogenophaga sp. TaxID=1904254 RepID=UPI0026170B84|nr:long-chain fatty acid--CoA ligase [Hydrogenophaga sp.]MCV0438915.1 long-chain fatty acid--CoA ligase [Hydrogenophaga sp.]
MEQVAIYNDWIEHHGRFRPQHRALVDDAKGTSVSFVELNRRVGALAAALQSRFDVQRGDRVVLVSKSCSEAFELQFACARVGAIFVPTNWRLSADELQWIVADCGPKAVFHDAEFKHLITGSQPSVEISVDASPNSPYEVLARSGASVVAHRMQGEDIWMILYTSGTTGRPKGAMLSYRMMHVNVLNWLSPTRITDRSVFLCAMPTFHTGGLNCYSNPVLYAGGTVVIQRDYEPSRALALMADKSVGITHFFGTPTHYSMLTQVPDFAHTPLPTLEIAGMGGSPSSNALIRDLVATGLPLQPAYGMTEIGPAIFVTEIHDVARKIGSCGHPTLHTEIKVVDEQGGACAVDQAGELYVRGPVCMSGYWNNAEATRNSFDDGWFKTGDGARIDEDGYVHIVDRLKDMFISGGENVYPAEIERVLGDHPAVLLSAVIGVADERWGEVGAAYVVLKDSAQASETELRAHCTLRLAKYKVPKSITLVPDLPRNASGKILKRAIKLGT